MEDYMASSQDSEHPAEKVYCANCIHCKIVREKDGNGSQYYLRVRCDAGKWRKKLAEKSI